LKDKEQLVDMGLFNADIEEFLDNSTAQTIVTFISSHRKAIANSVKKYMAASQAVVTSVVQWIRGWSNNNDMIENCMQDNEKIYSKHMDGRKRDGVGGNPRTYGIN
jgi:hypothetical protein